MVSTLCTSCGLEIPTAAQFCGQCGAPRPAAAGPSYADPEATSVLSQQPLGASAAPPQLGHYGARPGGGFDLRRWLFGSLQPATILVFAAAACGFALPSFVYAYSEPPFPTDGARAVLAILLALALVAAAFGTYAASHHIRDGREDRTASRLVFGVGVFACALTALEFLTTLGR